MKSEFQKASEFLCRRFRTPRCRPSTLHESGSRRSDVVVGCRAGVFGRTELESGKGEAAMKRAGRFGAARRRRAALLASTALGVATAVAAAGSAQAQDATWLANPVWNRFDYGANWSTGSVPTGTAYFGTSAVTALSFQGTTTAVGGWTFNGGASNYSFVNDSSLLLTFNAAGIVILGGSASITNRGNLIFYNTSTAGSASFTNDGGQFSFYDNSTAGGASIANTGIGIVYFSYASTAGNATIINDNVLYFQNISTAGNATITNNGGIAFDHFSTAGSATITNNGSLSFHDNSTAGNAAITNSANALVDFSSSAGPSGDNTISAGSIAGMGLYILGANALAVGSNGLTTTVGGVIAGVDGSLKKIGAGTLTLSGTNTYTGATVVYDGALVVDGSIAASSSLTMNSGTTLGGTGQLPTTIINSGATLAPGNSIGTLTVNGNLSFNAGSLYTVEVSPSAADRTNVTGTATLTGATVQAVALPGSFRSRSFTILNATGGLGGTTFAGLTTVNSFGSDVRSPHLTYDTNNVYLVLDPITLQLPASLTANQSNVAGAINRVVESGGAPPAGFDALLNMSGAQLPHALNQLSGQPGAAPTQAGFSTTNQFVAMLDPSGGNRGGPPGAGSLGYAATTPQDPKLRDAYAAVTGFDAPRGAVEARWGVWASGYGGSSTIGGSGASTTSRTAGTVVGADYRLSPDTLLGFALGGAQFDFALSDGLGGGRADLFQAGVYGRHGFGAGYLSGSLAYGWQDVTTERAVTVSGLDRLTANFKANSFSARGEAGWRVAPWPDTGFGVIPYAALQVTSFLLPSYAERVAAGSGQFALAYGAQTTTNLRSELGARLEHGLWISDGLLTLRGRLAWAHDSNTDRPVTATFQSLPGASFTVSGTRPAADSALVSAGAEMTWRSGISLAGTFEGEFSDTTQSYAGKGTVRYTW